MQLLIPDVNEKKKHHKGQQSPIFMAEPMRASNSFVGTEEYIAPACFVFYFLSEHTRSLMEVPYEILFIRFLQLLFLSKNLFPNVQEIITGAGHTSAVDWWALGNFVFL